MCHNTCFPTDPSTTVEENETSTKIHLLKSWLINDHFDAVEIFIRHLRDVYQNDTHNNIDLQRVAIILFVCQNF